MQHNINVTTHCTSYKCNFCIYQVGPIKPLPPECIECRCGNRFQIKAKLHPRDAVAWEKHQLFDRFIDEGINFPIVLWQRELLHKYLDKREDGPLYYRGCGRSHELAMIEVFLMIFKETYDANKKCNGI